MGSVHLYFLYISPGFMVFSQSLSGKEVTIAEHSSGCQALYQGCVCVCMCKHNLVCPVMRQVLILYYIEANHS